MFLSLKKKKFSILGIVYILTNYSLLGIMPQIWNFINSILKGEGLKLFILLYLVILIVLFCYFFLKGIFKTISNIISILLFIISFLIMFYFENNPGEKFHLIQYGIFGLILYFALKEFSLSREKFLILGFVIILSFKNNFVFK